MTEWKNDMLTCFFKILRPLIEYKKEHFSKAWPKKGRGDDGKMDIVFSFLEGSFHGNMASFSSEYSELM